ncbi:MULTISPECIES: DNA mismatch repair endonuclease MutL [unclassified Enterococcus]|uniref:DNA mismatch repair endonuclease MutL n=1 Tax=unclassified Enterococcus TaxID=2608891 RepID=UPI001556FEF2|nr:MULTISPECIES: DNA mismatch repair endonuclease MutL [unclassified Enterococcus]MBS7577992.1 DNA mismatch repair endonuclease MutL [Enterococcus sp. MMGLQ5-2]MBS7585318.1 DNA mismatch repair endonuclease MutL [Enterococcus sp. MMGLQ5-1]NPD13175.1 DNA mismatch repair endonuclease MutL [Enterococcus sp. MMGLQ5-1]NPD37823.1 DNA mismatch repair endonuclease MutL [Enterococcus sp. MMGLQ5-2]
MSKIIELSENLANQIAAGEVIERPASVVKELVENAIDAKSKQIVLSIEESGLRKIEVNDDGEGILRADILSAFKRHATSKIKDQDDLFRIRTLGFRGEALPSITSVAEVYMETATNEEDSGSSVLIKGGTIIKHEQFAKRKGTKIVITNLFYNTPARLKYIKSLQAELAHIGDVINRLSLAHPEIAFTLINDGKQMIKTAGSGDLQQAIAGIYGMTTARKMLAIRNEDLDFKISGFISLPELTRASKNYITILINGRYIKNFLINKALIEGYGSKLMVGRFPIAVLNIQIDPQLIDVNVHPTKQEVRLSKEKELMALIRQAVTQALSDEQLIPSAYENLRQGSKSFREVTEQLEVQLKANPSAHPYQQNEQSQYESADYRINESPIESQNMPKKDDFLVFPSIEQPKKLVNQSIVNPVIAQSSAMAENIQDHADESPLKEHPNLNFSEDGKRLLEAALQRLNDEPQQTFPMLEYFGQMRGTYLFAQSKEGLYIIDQHAAQERIKYEYFREKIGEVSDDQQTLLIPIILDYATGDFIKINEKLDLLRGIGIMLMPYGGNSFILRSHPVWFDKGLEESIIRELIDMLLITGEVSIQRLRAETAIMMSCKGSIKANHHLQEFEARQLLADLAECENPYNCPHGRPVLIHFSPTDMEKMFKRIQDPHKSSFDN